MMNRSLVGFWLFVATSAVSPIQAQALLDDDESAEEMVEVNADDEKIGLGLQDQHHTSGYWYLNRYRKIHHFQKMGALAAKQIALVKETLYTPKVVLFAFDLDETITDRAYKGSDREKGKVHLKPGIAALWRTILENGHRIAVVTANVRVDVESFLMDELGFDIENEQDYLLFRGLIAVKQPKLPERLHAAEALKPSKGHMLAEAIEEFGSFGSPIDGVVFSDDKTGFHLAVMQQKLKIPRVGLRVGHRLHTAVDPIGTYYDKHPKVSPGTSVGFATLLHKLVVNRTALGSVLYIANGTVFDDQTVRYLNTEVFLGVTEHDAFVTEASRLDNKLFASEASKFPVVIGQAPETKGSSKDEAYGFRRTRDFPPSRKPAIPPYFKKHRNDVKPASPSAEEL